MKIAILGAGRIAAIVAATLSKLEEIECYAVAARCIREGRTESDSTPLSHTIRIMELMDALRAKWGLVYPQEK